MTLSIVTVNLNNADGLSRTLESTFGAQAGFDDWEQIVVDGASADGSLAVLAAYRENPHLGWNVSEPDTGVFNAMNKGAAHARGDWLLFLNSGDTLEPGVLAKVFANPIDADIAYGDLTILKKTGPVTKRYPPPEQIKDWHFLYESLPHPATFISRRTFEKVGGYDESFRVVSDAKFFLMAFMGGARLKQLPLAVSRFGTDGISFNPKYGRIHRTERRLFLSATFGDRLAEMVTRPKPKPKPAAKPRSGLWRHMLAALAASVLFPLFFLAPVGRHAADCVPSSITEQSSRPLTLAPGDHLQLLYHFNLLGDYITGALPWFRDLWQFNTGDASRPRTPDFCYAPAALPYLAMRAMGIPEALAWNLDHLAFMMAGFMLCFALASRCGADHCTALFTAAIAACVPYRYATVATGSPTGFGMGLVPGVLLGADMAVRDRSLPGGILGGAMVLLLYATDLHCFMFAAGAAPAWCLFAAAFSPPRPQSPGVRRRSLAVTLAPLAAVLVETAILGVIARGAYTGTNVEAGRTIEEVAAHSPDWADMFAVNPSAPLAGQLKTGILLPLLFLAGIVRTAFSLFSAARRHSRQEVLFAAGGLLLAAAIVLSYALAVGTNGPLNALPLRILRAVAPPFRLVRQPIKVLCLLPSLCAAFFAIALSCRLTGGNSRRRSPLPLAIAAVAVLAAVAFDARGGIGIGLCRLDGANAAYERATAVARGRGKVPRAIVLPITRGDAPIAAAYQYWAQKSRMRIIDGYAAVRSHDYERDVYWRFRSMEDGDITDDQLRGLRDMGVTSVIVHEDALSRVRPTFGGGQTLRRMLANPRLRLLRSANGVWSFDLLPSGVNASPAPFEPTVEPAIHHRNFRKPKRKIVAGAECVAKVHDGRTGWLVRADAGADLELDASSFDSDGIHRTITTSFPADKNAPRGAVRLVFAPAPASGAGRSTRLHSYGPARVFDAMFATASATNAVRRICFADLPHRWGETFLGDDGQPAGIRLVPGWAPPCRAVSGPFLPLAPDSRRIRLAGFSASRLLPDGTDLGPPESIFLVRPDKTRVELKVGDTLPGDGTEPVSFDIPFDPDAGVVLELRELLFD